MTALMPTTPRLQTFATATPAVAMALATTGSAAAAMDGPAPAAKVGDVVVEVREVAHQRQKNAENAIKVG